MVQLLIIGRTVWIERLYGFDKLTKIHRLNGYLIIFLIIIHPIFITSSYAIAAKTNYLNQFNFFLLHYQDIKPAVASLVLFIAIVFISIYIIRNKIKYEYWYYVHLLTYLAIIFSFGHQLKLGGDFQEQPALKIYWLAIYIFVFLNLVFYRFLKPLLNFIRFGFSIEKIVKETEKVSSIYIKGKNIANFKIHAGQFMLFRFFQEHYWLESHPFSMSIEPNSSYLRISIKSLGDFTSQISRLKKGTKVLIEGPLGRFIGIGNKRKYLFIAGGIGITPIRAIIGSLEGDNDVILLNSVKDEKEIVFKNELDHLVKKHTYTIKYLFTENKNNPDINGRIDKDKILKFVKDVKEREIYICGPKSMMNSLKIILQELGVPPVSIHMEEFAL
jgi:predicted ferric reductase